MRIFRLLTGQMVACSKALLSITTIIMQPFIRCGCRRSGFDAQSGDLLEEKKSAEVRLVLCCVRHNQLIA